MPKFSFPKLSPKSWGYLAAAGVVALIVAAAVEYIARTQFGFSPDGIRYAAFNVASLVVAYLLVAGIGREQKGKN
ncbi:hypothetical protein HNR60_003516 [Rhodopseudomonas rhenobacensis]|uniref:Uncharacterized protein n=1 Tax=Rhodopseudomonas rhenobacensis TaxID=87461 RepID=A0A7W7Z675_9BRAD|nr:hypothetical protein [Rhodopseudomonas rhenobacensis]MBB5048746.1 hypothetical protein [Rhodopseudomonas rhenobacensis]